MRLTFPSENSYSNSIFKEYSESDVLNEAYEGRFFDPFPVKNT